MAEIENLGRLCIKNLPRNYTAKQLRELCSRSGEVTDARIVNTKRGESRCLGFVGFRTPEQAAECKNYYNNSYVGAMRINVEFAFAPGQANVSRPWSKYSVGSSRHKDRVEAGKATERVEIVRSIADYQVKETMQNFKNLTDTERDPLYNDPRFRDFLSLMAPRNTEKTWANDDAVVSAVSPEVAAATAAANSAKKKKKKKKRTGSDDDDEASSSDDEDYDNNPVLEQSGQTGEGEEEAQAAALDDFVKNRQDDEAFDSSDDDDFLSLPSEIAAKANGGQAEEKKVFEEPTGRDMTGRLFIRNLPYNVAPEDLEALFAKFGEIKSLDLPLDDNKRNKGVCFIKYGYPDHAAAAYAAMDGTVFQGRLMHVMPAKEREAPDYIKESAQYKIQSSYKAQKEAQREERAKDVRNWNTLFINSDTVAAAIANKFEMRKADVLAADSSVSMAVRLALAETQLVSETKEFLEGEGVDLTAFQGGKNGARSKTVIMVKNIPFDTHEDDLRRVFAKKGAVGRVVVPPSKTVALVEFLETNEAKKAFLGLAYKRFKNVPLYLEWAPADVFTSASTEAGSIKARESKATGNQADGGEEAAEVQEGSTLYVTNLNFSTTEKTLIALFSEVAKPRSVTITKVLNRKRKHESDAIYLSKGFGFAEFESKAVAKKVLIALQNTDVDGFQMSLKFANATQPKKRATKTNKSKLAGGDKLSKTKIIIRNIPFEATSTEIRELVGTYGKIQSLRLPRKFDGQHRGFVFVDFVTQQECKTAMEAIAATHLYGRHLVVERAKEEETLEQKTERVAAQYEADAAAEYGKVITKNDLHTDKLKKKKKKDKKKHKKRRTETGAVEA